MFGRWLSLFGVAVLVGCKAFTWVPITRSTSPDNSASVTVSQRCVAPDCLLRIIVTRSGHSQIVFDDGLDRSPRAAFVAWSADSRKVAVHVCDPLGKNVSVGYDLPNELRAIPQGSATAMIRTEIERRFHPGGDALSWVCSEAGLKNLRP